MFLRRVSRSIKSTPWARENWSRTVRNNKTASKAGRKRLPPELVKEVTKVLEAAVVPELAYLQPSSPNPHAQAVESGVSGKSWLVVTLPPFPKEGSRLPSGL